LKTQSILKNYLKYNCLERVALIVRNKIEYSDNIELLKTSNKIEYNYRLILLEMQVKIDKAATKASFNIEELYLELLFLDLRYYFNRYNIFFILSLDSNERPILYTSVLFKTLNNFKRNANKQ